MNEASLISALDNRTLRLVTNAAASHDAEAVLGLLGTPPKEHVIARLLFERGLLPYDPAGRFPSLAGDCMPSMEASAASVFLNALDEFADRRPKGARLDWVELAMGLAWAREALRNAAWDLSIVESPGVEAGSRCRDAMDVAILRSMLLGFIQRSRSARTRRGDFIVGGAAADDARTGVSLDVGTASSWLRPGDTALTVCIAWEMTTGTLLGAGLREGHPSSQILLDWTLAWLDQLASTPGRCGKLLRLEEPVSRGFMDPCRKAGVDVWLEPPCRSPFAGARKERCFRALERFAHGGWDGEGAMGETLQDLQERLRWLVSCRPVLAPIDAPKRRKAARRMTRLRWDKPRHG